jgi:hypothetical protein
MVTTDSAWFPTHNLLIGPLSLSRLCFGPCVASALMRAGPHTTQRGREFDRDLTHDATDDGQPLIGHAARHAGDGDRRDRFALMIVDHGGDATQPDFSSVASRRRTVEVDKPVRMARSLKR